MGGVPARRWRGPRHAPAMTEAPEMTAPAAVISGGHGGEHDDMRARVEQQRPELLALAERLLGVDPFERLDGGTTYLQPAIYCASIAGWDAAGNGVRPVAFAGHSLGEFAAVVLAGAMSAEDGLRMVVTRGRLCAEAALARPGGMLILKAGEQ